MKLRNNSRIWRSGVLLLLCLLLTSGAFAQRTTGAITGIAKDPNGAVVSGAKVTIENADTHQTIDLVTDAAGAFSAPNLQPGIYKVKVEADGFGLYSTTANVAVNATNTVNAGLKLGAAETTVEVDSTPNVVNTVQSTVQGTVTGTQIANLPLNGRNFLDLAQQQPGAQVIDGGNFDPTKAGLVGVSLGGRTGRTTKIQVDGVDISDGNVGTTVLNISNEAIQEFGIQQSQLDPSTDITSSGAVNIVTKSGTNKYHGSGFGLFRDSAYAADSRQDKSGGGSKPASSRKLYGGNVGGPVIHDKLFFHAEYEKNDTVNSASVSTPLFPQFTGSYGTPFYEYLAGGRIDWNATQKLKVFGRFNFNENNGVASGGASVGGTILQAFSNKNYANTTVAGADYASGNLSHSFRFSYLNFNNVIIDGNPLSGTPTTIDPAGTLPIALRIIGAIQVGPNRLAPQKTFQDNRQVKYDGSYFKGRHTLRFGADFNNIDMGGLANFYGIGATVRSRNTAGNRAFAAASPFAPGGIANPLNWPLVDNASGGPAAGAYSIRLGNGLGYFSPTPGEGEPFGYYNDKRTGLYFQDTWRYNDRVTFNAGLRWMYNTMIAPPFQRDPTLAAFDPSLTGFIHQPTDNFSPQGGFAWQLGSSGKTVIRGGAGLFYETNVLNNTLFDTVSNTVAGYGNLTTTNSGFPGSGGNLVLGPTGNTLFDFATQCVGAGLAATPNSCFGAPIGRVLPFVAQAQNLYQAAYRASIANYPLPGSKTPIASSFDVPFSGAIFDTHYHTPYSEQFNIGIQHEIKPGLVFSADYLRNVGRHFAQTIDRNRVGAANNLNLPAAQAAIAATLAQCGAANINAAIASCPTSVSGTGKATIADFAANGLSAGGAFGGNNRNFGTVAVIQSSGDSLFQAMQLRLSGNAFSAGWLKKVYTNLTYQYGSAEGAVGAGAAADQDFGGVAFSNDKPNSYFGPVTNDRRHQIGVTFLTELPWHFNLNTTSSFRSPQPSNITSGITGIAGEDIFLTDFDGDGTVGDPIAQVGAFNRSISAGDYNAYITGFNKANVGQFTPAGQAVIAAGLFTSAQLTSLKGTRQAELLAQSGNLGNPWFQNTDLRLSNKINIGERWVVEPMVEVFNVFNRQNYLPLTGLADGSALSVNDQTVNANGKPLSRVQNMTRAGIGLNFAPGVPRAFQFGVRLTF